MLLNVDGDLLRDDRRVEGHMVHVAQLQLQGVLARCQRQLGLCLRLAEMNVIGIGRDDCPCWNYFLGIDQQMVVTSILGGIPRWRQRNVLDSEFDFESLRYSPTIFRRNDGHFSPLGCRRSRTGQH